MFNNEPPGKVAEKIDREVGAGNAVACVIYEDRRKRLLRAETGIAIAN
jgi:hypothetical protein